MPSTNLTARQTAEAIEQFGDDLAALNRALDKLCERMSRDTVDAINALPDQDKLDTIADAFRALGDRLCRECDAAEEADDRRRDNPLEPDFRRLGQ
jgi:ElaB/YqjD/DUF883 family membrane-anchored ribosome-binding protein